MWKWCVFAYLCVFGLVAEEKRMVVVIPSYNNATWYQANLESVFAQEYKNYRVIYVDDNSSDGTKELVEAFIEAKGMQDRVTLIHNTVRRGALFNIYYAVTLCDPGEIVALLDGDDWFFCKEALQIVNQAYADPDVWLTYGQFCYYPQSALGFAREVPSGIIAANGIRKYDWVTTHLRTFYAALFQKINIQDLMYGQGFFTAAWDLACMWPMVEMAGWHTRFIPEVLYVYNVQNPLNDHKVNAGLQQYFTYLIQRKTPYRPLSSLPEIYKRNS